MIFLQLYFYVVALSAMGIYAYSLVSDKTSIQLVDLPRAAALSLAGPLLIVGVVLFGLFVLVYPDVRH